MLNGTTLRLLAMASATLGAACTGYVADSSGPGPGPGPGPSDGTPGGGGTNASGGTGNIAQTFSPGPSRLRRLTSFEYKNSVVDLLGPGTTVATELEADAKYNNLSAIAASTISLSAIVTEQFESSALALSEALANDAARRAAVVGCTPTGATDQACLRSFVTSFGRRAFRRPLTTEEIDLYAGLGNSAMETLSDFWGGVRYALAGLLQSPNFLYRTEIGATAENGRRRLDDFELASRLSYLIWSTTPDDALLEAAANGALSTPDGLKAQAERLLASPRAADAIVNVLSEMLQLAEVDALPQSPDSFPAAASATLGASMRMETQSLLRDIVFTRNGDYRELFTSTRTFVNAELAALYGVPAPSEGFAEITLPADGPRAGYLGHGSFLALNARPTHTSPTLRGLFIVGALMCDSIPPPPADVIAELAEKDRDKTLREQLLVHQQDDYCAGCHVRMDPMGLALEHFDAIGAYRENDRGMALDVSGSLGEVTFNGARELGEALANGPLTADGNPETADCLVRNLYRAATGHLEGEGEQSAVRELSSTFSANDFRVQSVLSALITSDAFRFVGEPE